MPPSPEASLPQTVPVAKALRPPTEAQRNAELSALCAGPRPLPAGFEKKKRKARFINCAGEHSEMKACGSLCLLRYRLHLAASIRPAPFDCP